MRNEEFASGQPAEGLSNDDKTVLDIARRHTNSSKRGALDMEVRETLDISPTAYWMKVNRLIDNPHALEHDPSTINRLQTIRERGRQLRTDDRNARKAQ